MKLKVKVRRFHIVNAMRKNSQHCMIADAIHSACKDAKWVSVDLQSIAWSDPKQGKRFIAFTPPKAQLQLLRFDNGKDVSPFMFTVVSAVEKKMGWQANHPNISRKGKKYKKTGKHVRRPRLERKFGIKMFSEDQLAA